MYKKPIYIILQKLTFILEVSSIFFVVVVMQQHSSPEIRVLEGEKAIEALEECITQLEENKPGKLTQKQTETMIKLAKTLITVIDDETTILKTLKASQIWPKLKTTLNSFISQIFQGATALIPPESPIIPTPQTSSKGIHNHPPPPKQIK